MEDIEGRVAVVTGAASGIGLATAHRLADEGMHLVLADIEATSLAAAEEAIKAKGREVLAVPTDVSSPEAVEREDRFYLFPAQPEILELLDTRVTGILERRNPDPAGPRSG